MTIEKDQQPTLADGGNSAPKFMKAEINSLKGRLEEKQARSHATARWEGMIEDCEIILKHLETKIR